MPGLPVDSPFWRFGAFSGAAGVMLGAFGTVCLSPHDSIESHKAKATKVTQYDTDKNRSTATSTCHFVGSIQRPIQTCSARTCSARSSVNMNVVRGSRAAKYRGSQDAYGQEYSSSREILGLYLQLIRLCGHGFELN
eukprot:698189-Amorphochlora_amoeboformis.AAC.1